MTSKLPKINRKLRLKMQRSVSIDSNIHLPVISKEKKANPGKSDKRPISAKIISTDRECLYEAAIEDCISELTSVLYDSIPGLSIKTLSNTLSGLGLQASEAELLDISSDSTLNGVIKISEGFAYKYYSEQQAKVKEFPNILFWLLDNDKDGIITLDDLKNVSILTGENDLQLINGMYLMLQELSKGRPIDVTIFNNLLERESISPHKDMV